MVSMMRSTNARALTLHSAADVTEAWERKDAPGKTHCLSTERTSTSTLNFLAHSRDSPKPYSKARHPPPSITPCSSDGMEVVTVTFVT